MWSNLRDCKNWSTMTRRNAKNGAVVDVAEVPRRDVSDDQIAEAVRDCGGFPSLVADRLAMTMADLLARAKASALVAGAFAEAKQRMVDRAKAKAMSVMLGDANTPPDPLMLRWFIERYE